MARALQTEATVAARQARQAELRLAVGDPIELLTEQTVARLHNIQNGQD
jgi:hypothetical protein